MTELITEHFLSTRGTEIRQGQELVARIPPPVPRPRKESTIMRTLLVALLLLLLSAGSAAAQAGDPEAGKSLWEGAASRCWQCHGENGEGAFGPDLAGRHLTVAQFTKAVREPWGIMPAYIESQVSDQEIANLVAYFGSLPSPEQPGPWRFDVPAGAPHGQELALATVGCAQCHGRTVNGQRRAMGAVGADFEWYKSLVYSHTTTEPQYWESVGQTPAVRIRMGNYSRSRLPESMLREMYDWARDLGFRAALTGRLSAGVAEAAGVTYTLNVENIGLPGKGLTAEELTVSLVVPAGADVVSTTGAGYQGVRIDEQAEANVAVWQLPRLAPKDHQTYTLTLSQAGTAQDNVRGSIQWTKPVLKTGPIDRATIAPAPLAP